MAVRDLMEPSDIRSWDDFMEAVDELPRRDQVHVRQTFDIMLDKEYTAQALAKYGVQVDGKGR